MPIKSFLLLIGLLIGFSCGSTSQNGKEKTSAEINRLVDVEIYTPTYPVLIGKDRNPLLRINITPIGSEKALDVEAFSVEISSLKSENMEELQIYFTGSDEGFSDERPFGKTTVRQVNSTLKGKQSLSQGANYFWVSGKLSEHVDLSKTISVRPLSVKINSQDYAIESTEKNTTKRIGHALRQHNQEGIHTYRIPGLATTNQGTLIAVYDNRRNGSVDLQEDVDIGMSRSTDQGETWATMKIIMDMGEYRGKPQNENGIGDPSILVDRQTNTIWVAAVWAHGHPGKRNWFASKPGIEPEQTSQFVLVKSEDDGLTWSGPINITMQIKDPKWHLLLQGPGKGITLNDGTLVFPAQFKDQEEMPHSTIIYSKDRGKNWKIGTSAKSNTTESQVVELEDGSLMLNMRDNRGSGSDGRNGTGARSVAITKDLGQTWIEHATSRKALPEPVCMASLVKHQMPSGENILIFSNPDHTETRKNITIKISLDEGMTWPTTYHTLIDEGTGRGYSCLTSIDDSTIGILYEGSQADMVFQKFKIAELMVD